MSATCEYGRGGAEPRRKGRFGDTEVSLMIKLTKLNGDRFVVNAELIRFIESRPDTYITLTTEDRLIVRESVEEVVKRSIAYARAIRTVPGLE